jgi:hypothetical protein
MGNGQDYCWRIGRSSFSLSLSISKAMVFPKSQVLRPSIVKLHGISSSNRHLRFHFLKLSHCTHCIPFRSVSSHASHTHVRHICNFLSYRARHSQSQPLIAVSLVCLGSTSSALPIQSTLLHRMSTWPSVPELTPPTNSSVLESWMFMYRSTETSLPLYSVSPHFRRTTMSLSTLRSG